MGWKLSKTDTVIVAIHAALLPTGSKGEVLCFGDWAEKTFTLVSLYDIGGDTIDAIEKNEQEIIDGLKKYPDTMVFCGGHSFLADGRLLVAGGTKAWPEQAPNDPFDPKKPHGHHYSGDRACWMYLPHKKMWRRIKDLHFQPGSTSDGGGRWYPTLVTLANGEVFAVGGHPDVSDDYEGRHNNNTPERYSPGLNSWALMTAERTAPNSEETDSYPRFHLLPKDGLLFSVTAGNGAKRSFDPFSGKWVGPDINASQLTTPFYDRGSTCTSVLLPLLPPYYKPRILACNGVTAFRIDVEDAPHQWVSTVGREGSAAGKIRNNACAVLLPTGQVFVTGGNELGSNAGTVEKAVSKPEIYTPGINWSKGDFSNITAEGKEGWKTIEEPSPIHRGYHSVALLLPDGRVFTAGSTEDAIVKAEKNIAFYEPWYFNEQNDRPVIKDCPASVGHNQSFFVATDDADRIDRCAMIRCGSVTHAFDADQRYVGLNFSKKDNGVTINAPPDANVAPPGYYMVWIIDTDGRPCKQASFIRLFKQKCLITADFSTFSVHDVDAQGLPAVFENAIYLTYDGYLPSEVTQPTLTVSFANNDPVPGLEYSIGPAKYEGDHQDEDVAQRISYPVKFTFTDKQAFSTIPSNDAFKEFLVYAQMGQDICFTKLTLSKNANPRMSDGTPHWLSIDLRVFSTGPKKTFSAGVEHPSGDNAPYNYIKALLQKYNEMATNDPHPFDSLPQDQDTNHLALYSEHLNGDKIYNYAVARVRFTAPEGVNAENVRVFFRLWMTGWTGMTYELDQNGRPKNSYRRHGDGPAATPLLGLTGDEVNNIPCFAEERVGDMEAQTDETNLIKLLEGKGKQEVHAYCGCWLDMNQDTAYFPINPGQNNGPFNNKVSVQDLMRGPHQCLVAEIHYTPDPIPSGATPASHDNIAQRNILFDKTPNPGGFGSHLVHHTFEIKPSPVSFEHSIEASHAATVIRLHPDELCIEWGNLPKDAHVTLFLPQVDVQEILNYAARRHGPTVLSYAGAHTLHCKITNLTYIPIPGPFEKNLAGLMSIQLPPNVIAGQRFSVIVRQVDGRRYRVIGTFQFDILVGKSAKILPNLERNLSVLKHIALSIPQDNRWHAVFVRYLEELAARVRALGGDPDSIAPTSTGSGVSEEKPLPVPERESRTSYTGKICQIIYDCFGDFEGFVVDLCPKERFFKCQERSLEEIVKRACNERIKVTVYVHAEDKTRPFKIALHC